MENNQEGQNTPTAFLVDLVSNRKIPVATPRCRVGRDDLNDIVISGDQSISRFHFIISYENGEFTAQDAKSRHGTFLNGNQITSPEPIKDGDVLKVGVSLFWFVVEAAEKAGDGSPKPAAIEGQEHKPIQFNAGEGRKETTGPKDLTQELAKPDASLMDKLEQAANSIQLETKPETKTEAPKASLASLLQPLNEAQDEKSKQDEKSGQEEADIKSKLAAKDKELLAEVEPAAESKAESADTKTTDNLDALPKEESDFPKKVLNKPSDTVTLAAMPTPEQEERKEKVIEPPKLGLANLFTQVENAAAEQEKADREEKERLEKEEREEREKEEREEKEKEAKRQAEVTSLSSLASALEETGNGKAEETGTQTSENGDGAGTQKDKLIAEQSQTGEITVENSAEIAKGQVAAQAETTADSDIKPETAKQAEPAADASAEVQEHVSSSGETVVQQTVTYQELSTDLDKVATAGASTVPDWCKQYFSDEIGKLNHELDELNDQVRLAQQKIRDVETRVALTKGIRNTLLTTTGDELVEAAGKVLGLLGWKVTIAAEDKHELRLEAEEGQVCIARVIWTTTQAERSHLGQLSISQTRYWCEKGTEPKGILIVSKIGDGPPSTGGDSAEDLELADYAGKKNVCLMTTLQLLSLYKEVALNDAKPDALRNSVAKASGWLPGHNLEPGTTEPSDKEEAGSNKLSSLLSA